MSEISLDSGQLNSNPKATVNQLTGERIKRNKPELYETTIRALASGLSVRKVAEITGLAKDTVYMIGLRSLGRDEIREKVESRWLRVAELTAVELEERLSDPDKLKKVSTTQLCTISAIATDKVTNLAKTRGELGIRTPVANLTQNNIYQPTISKQDADRIIESIENKYENRQDELQRALPAE